MFLRIRQVINDDSIMAHFGPLVNASPTHLQNKTKKRVSQNNHNRNNLKMIGVHSVMTEQLTTIHRFRITCKSFKYIFMNLLNDEHFILEQQYCELLKE